MYMSASYFIAVCIFRSVSHTHEHKCITYTPLHNSVCVTARVRQCVCVYTKGEAQTTTSTVHFRQNLASGRVESTTLTHKCSYIAGYDLAFGLIKNRFSLIDNRL